MPIIATLVLFAAYKAAPESSVEKRVQEESLNMKKGVYFTFYEQNKT